MILVGPNYKNRAKKTLSDLTKVSKMWKLEMWFNMPVENYLNKMVC